MTDKHLSLIELAEHFQLPLRKMHHLYYRRTDCPQPVGKRCNSSGGKWVPLFSLNQFEAHLQDLGLIDKNRGRDKITLRESAEMLKLSFTRTKELFKKDPNFPKTLSDKRFYRRLGHYEFIRSEMLEYKALRRKRKDMIRVEKIDPIVLPGTLSGDIRQFLTSPPKRLPRVTPTGNAQTVRVRTEGVAGKW